MLKLYEKIMIIFEEFFTFTEKLNVNFKFII